MRCPSCNTLWPEELAGILKFCGACGAPMKPASLALSHTKDPGGELRFVTVLFADLVGFTTYAEDRAADEVSNIVGDLLQRLGKVVEEQNGAVYQFLGDAIVATFGLPHPDSSAARNAIRAGLGLQRAVVEFNRSKGSSFELRVGIHAGEVMFRALGGSWTMMGDTMNTASRVQSGATPGKVWITRPVYEEARRYFSFVLRPGVELKGKNKAVQSYEVLAERQTPMVNLPVFVGREAELEKLHGLLFEAIQEKTLRATVIRGPAGVGKSRLVWELSDWIQRQPDTYRLDVIQYDHSEHLPSHGLNSLIRQRFILPVDLDETAIVNKLRERMPAEDAYVEAGREDLTVEFLAFVLGILKPDFHIQNLDGKGQWDGAFQELKTWIEGHASQTPWILVFEDVQKGDAETAKFIEWALRMKWKTPVLVAVTLREEDFTPQCYWYDPITSWLQGNLMEEIRLREIPPDLLAVALMSMVDGSISESLAHRIAEHTEGNPLFATELVLLLREMAGRGAEPVWEKLALPGTIREVMEARLERLGVDGKEVAKRGALVGRRFTREAVERIWDANQLNLTNGITVLRETETVYEESSKLFSGEIEQVFRHGRLHETALARIPREDRLRWLAGLEEWARHKLNDQGAQWEGAGVQLIPLITRSKEEHGDAAEASLWYELLGLLHHKQFRLSECVVALNSAAENATGARKLVLMKKIIEARRYSGDLEQALQVNREWYVETDERTIDLPEDFRRWYTSLATDLLNRWDKITLDEAQAGLDLAHADVLTGLGNITEAREAYEAIGLRLEALPASTALDTLWMRWGGSFSFLLDELAADFEASRQVCEQVFNRVDPDQPGLEAERITLLGIEWVQEMRLRHYKRLRELDDERLKIAQESNLLRSQAAIWNSKGLAAELVGDLPEMEECLEKGVSISQTIGYRRGEAIGLHNLASTFYEMGQYDKANQYEERYLAVSRVTGNPLAEAYAPALFGSIALEQGDDEKAEILLRQSLEIAELNSWVVLISGAHSSIALMYLYRWLAQPDDRHLLNQAVREMEAAQDSYVDERGEILAFNAILYCLVGDMDKAEAALNLGMKATETAGEVDMTWMRFAYGVLRGDDCRQSRMSAYHWLKDKGFVRAAGLIERIEAIL